MKLATNNFAFLPSVLVGFVLLALSSVGFSQDATNAYSGHVTVNGDTKFYQTTHPGDLTPVPVVEVTIHNQTTQSRTYFVNVSNFSKVPSSVINWGIHSRGGRTVTVSANETQSFEVNCPDYDPLIYYGSLPKTVSVNSQFTEQATLARNGSFIDIAYVVVNVTGQMSGSFGVAWPPGNTDLSMEGDFAYQTIHLYDTGGGPIPPREGLPDRLMVKAKITDKRGQGGAKVAVRISNLPDKQLGSTTTGTQTFQLATSEALEGKPLDGAKVELLLDGTSIRSRTLPSFTGLMTVDFGNVELVNSCRECATGNCIAGHVTAGLEAKH